MILTLLLGLALWQQQFSVAKAAPVFDTITVTNTSDNDPGSLRQAILTASSGDTINFDTAGVFATPQTITLTTGELVINKSLTIDGPGASQLTVSGNNASRVFYISVSFPNTVTLDGLTVSGGNGTGAVNSGHGCGIYNGGGVLTLTNSTVSGNSGGGGSGGGGILNFGTLTLTNSTVSGNSAFFGGGIGAQGFLTLTNSTVSGNSAFNGGGIRIAGSLTLANSTVSGNSATAPGSLGGGIWLEFGGGTLTNCTVSGNSAFSGGGIRNQGSLTLNNTIVAGNFIGFGTTPSEIDGLMVASANNNLIGDAGTSGGITNGVNGNKVGIAGAGTIDINTVLNIMLANNGGPTKTHRLKPNSPAIDAGTNALAVDASNIALISDQRGAGFPRTLDGNGDSTALVDIGAFEAVFNATPTITGATIARQAGSPASSSQIATVDDTESGAGGVTVTVTSANPSNGVTVSNIVNASGMVTADVVADCTATDASFTLTVTDGDSATATATLNVTVNANTAPTVGSYSATTVATGSSITVTPSAAPADNVSISSTTGSAPSFTGTLSVNAAGVVSIGNAGSPGNYVVTVTVTDNCGLSTTPTFNLSVTTLFNFVGFFQPVDNLPTVNSVTAGQSIPVKFRLTGYQGMAIFAAGFPASQTVACSSGISGPIEETVTAGSSSLSYDATTDQYKYVWKTEKAWKGTCRKLVVKFSDGTTREAVFQFK